MNIRYPWLLPILLLTAIRMNRVDTEYPYQQLYAVLFHMFSLNGFHAYDNWTTPLFSLDNESMHTPIYVKDYSELDEGVGSRPKSDLYQAIIDSLDEIGNFRMRKGRSCQNQCGRSHHCSCKPICKMLNTCCFDFEEACSHIYQMTSLLTNSDNLSKRIDTECFGNSLTVSSCSTDSYLQKRNVQGLFGKRDEHTTTSSVYENHTDIDRPMNETGLIAILRLLLSFSHEPESERFLGDAGKMLISVPILDLSTGMSYKNISMYICNGASIPHATPWDVYVPIERGQSVAWSKTTDVKNIFSLVNITTAYYPVLDKYQSENIEQCFVETVSTCPDDFWDEDVIEACNSINLFLISYHRQRNSNIQVTYKNPFCLFCNTANDGNPREIFARGLGVAEGIAKQGLLFVFTPRMNSHKFLIQNKFITKVNIPAWESVSCNIIPPSLGLVQETNISVRDIAEKAFDATAARKAHDNMMILRSECSIEKCMNASQVTRCARNWHFLLMLPPAKYKLSDDYLINLVETWKSTLLNNFSYSDVWLEGSGEPYIQHFDPVNLIGRFQYSHALYIRIQSGVLTYFHKVKYSWTSQQRNAIIGMMEAAGFPFKSGKQYVCSVNLFGIARRGYYFPCTKDASVIFVSMNTTGCAACPSCPAFHGDMSGYLMLFALASLLPMSLLGDIL